MDTDKRLAILGKWYGLYDDFMADILVFCKRGCATCCTCNVTCTTLEGLYVHNHLEAEHTLQQHTSLLTVAPKNRFQPAVTTNQLAKLCLAEQDLPLEVNDPTAGPCIWLVDAACSIYQARPFGCRALCSMKNCANHGEAVMSPLVLSVNNLMQQYIEALDRPGATGNIVDVLKYLSEETNLEVYTKEQAMMLPPTLLSNHRFTSLMIPPEHRQQLQPLTRAMGQVIGQIS